MRSRPFAATRVTESIQPANDAQAAYKERALRIPAHYVARLTALLCSNAHATSPDNCSACAAAKYSCSPSRGPWRER